jgi:hypothetical protein
MTLVGVGTTAPGITIAFHSMEDALKAQWAGRGCDFVIGIGFQNEPGSTSERTRACTLGVHRVKQAINKNRIQKRRQRAALGYPTSTTVIRREPPGARPDGAITSAKRYVCFLMHLAARIASDSCSSSVTSQHYSRHRFGSCR